MCLDLYQLIILPLHKESHALFLDLLQLIVTGYFSILTKNALGHRWWFAPCLKCNLRENQAKTAKIEKKQSFHDMILKKCVYLQQP